MKDYIMTIPKTAVRLAVEPLLSQAEDAAVISVNSSTNILLVG